MYLTPAAVRQDTGIKPQDIGFSSVDELDAWIAERLLELDAVASEYTHRTWTDADVPAGIRLVVRDMMRNVIGNAIQVRSGYVVNVGEWRARVTEANILTDSAKEILDMYVIAGASSNYPDGLTAIRMFRVRRKDEMP